MKATRILMALLLVGILAGTTPGEAARSKPLTVRGGFVNEAGFGVCDPRETQLGPGAPPETITFSCLSGSLYDGGWTGHTILELAGTLYPNGDIIGTFDEWLYAVYTGDDSYGGLHYEGTFSIDGATSGFAAEATILGGTCAFEGSSGKISFTGHSLHGGYVATWSRPRTTAPPGCIPFVLPS